MDPEICIIYTLTDTYQDLNNIFFWDISNRVFLVWHIYRLGDNGDHGRLAKGNGKTFMKSSFNINLVEVESCTISKNNTCDYIFWPP
jgi:hypothetical protein